MTTCNRYITTFVLFLAALLPHSSTAQKSTEEIAQAIEAFMTVHADDTPSICEEAAAREAAAIDADELLRYVEVAERILYTPSCDSRQRAVYRALIRQLLQNGGDELALLRYRYQYEMLTRNNEGEAADDFAFTDIDGNDRQLSHIQADYTLLIFNDPDCEECAMLRRSILSDQTLSAAITDGRLQVIAIFPDLPTPEWAEQMHHYPASWIKGYSEDVSDLYDVRQLPATYLLDASHTILSRNAAVTEMAALITANHHPQ